MGRPRHVGNSLPYILPRRPGPTLRSKTRIDKSGNCSSMSSAVFEEFLLPWEQEVSKNPTMGNTNAINVRDLISSRGLPTPRAGPFYFCNRPLPGTADSAMFARGFERSSFVGWGTLGPAMKHQTHAYSEPSRQWYQSVFSPSEVPYGRSSSQKRQSNVCSGFRELRGRPVVLYQVEESCGAEGNMFIFWALRHRPDPPPRTSQRPQTPRTFC